PCQMPHAITSRPVPYAQGAQRAAKRSKEGGEPSWWNQRTTGFMGTVQLENGLRAAVASGAARAGRPLGACPASGRNSGAQAYQSPDTCQSAAYGNSAVPWRERRSGMMQRRRAHACAMVRSGDEGDG